MPDDTAFLDLIRRVRGRDELAAAELFRLYESELRRIVRVRFTSSRLRRLLDSEDICQSVFGNLYLRLTAGQFDLSSPGELLRLLTTMAHHRLQDVARRLLARRRGGRASSLGPQHLEHVRQPGTDPARQAALHDLHAQAISLLSEEDRELARQRALGRGWAELAGQSGDSPEGLRKRLSRALDRVARRMGFDDFEDS